MPPYFAELAERGKAVIEATLSGSYVGDISTQSELPIIVTIISGGSDQDG
jgi:hypothetical protein